MAWDVEYTDEFGEWWATLDDAERASITAYVGLLEERGPQLDHPFTLDSRSLATATCANCVFSTRADPIVYSTPSIHGDPPFC